MQDKSARFLRGISARR
uniref:Uncharacterized protein n=1 Tax=Arundo donax TaxID=35708 RepID=A0A0A9H3M9_ARUDO